MNAALRVPFVYGYLRGVEDLHAGCGGISRECASVSNMYAFRYVPAKAGLERK